mgnify:CR=1 FL=1
MALGQRRDRYSRIRLWGSVGYGSAAVAVGTLRDGDPKVIMSGASIEDTRTEVSVTTVGRVARSMELGAGGYRTVLDRLGSRSS